MKKTEFSNLKVNDLIKLRTFNEMLEVKGASLITNDDGVTLLKCIDGDYSPMLVDVENLTGSSHIVSHLCKDEDGEPFVILDNGKRYTRKFIKHGQQEVLERLSVACKILHTLLEVDVEAERLAPNLFSLELGNKVFLGTVQEVHSFVQGVMVAYACISTDSDAEKNQENTEN